MCYQHVSSLFVLYTSLCHAATVLFPVSGARLESYKDAKLFYVPCYGNCIGVSGESRAFENISENVVADGCGSYLLNYDSGNKMLCVLRSDTGQILQVTDDI